VSLTTIVCGGCGGVYAITERFRKQCANEGTSWHCPYCNVGWGYSGNSENARLKKQVANLSAQADRTNAHIGRLNHELETTERSRAAMKGQVTKMKNRAANGVCPCCSRTFTNLARHMKSKHPDFAETP